MARLSDEERGSGDVRDSACSEGASGASPKKAGARSSAGPKKAAAVRGSRLNNDGSSPRPSPRRWKKDEHKGKESKDPPANGSARDGEDKAKTSVIEAADEHRASGASNGDSKDSPGSGKKGSSKRAPKPEASDLDKALAKAPALASSLDANGVDDLKRASKESSEPGSAASAPAPAVAQPARKTKLRWDTVVAVGALIVPICSEHGQAPMAFRKGDGDGATAIDMSDLLDWVKENRAVGARASCTECGAQLGVIVKKGDKGAPRYFGPDIPTGPRLNTGSSWLPAFCVGCDLSIGGEA